MQTLHPLYCTLCQRTARGAAVFRLKLVSPFLCLKSRRLIRPFFTLSANCFLFLPYFLSSNEQRQWSFVFVLSALFPFQSFCPP